MDNCVIYSLNVYRMMHISLRNYKLKLNSLRSPMVYRQSVSATQEQHLFMTGFYKVDTKYSEISHKYFLY